MSIKSVLRLEMKNRLKEVSGDDLLSQSRHLLDHVLSLTAFRQATTVSAYLSMKGEIDTYPLIKRMLEDDFEKKVYIPKVVGKEAKDLVMIPLPSFDSIKTFPKNSWGIPEPEVTEDVIVRQAALLADIDLVLLPGVAFDYRGGRLGHGKGYYDCFVHRLQEARRSAGKPAATLIGLALNQQIVENVPIEDHDQRLDFIVTAQGVLFQRP
eukprot:gene3175-3477_t